MKMVHTTNGRNYSAQPHVCGQGRGKTKSRSVRSSSRKTHMEDARAAPHFPRSVPTHFDVKCESGLIHDNILRAEPLSSGSNGNLSMPIQKLVQSSQRRGVANSPEPLAGAHELLLTHQEISGSGEYHRTLRRPEEVIRNDSSFGDRRPSGIYQLQKCPKTSPKNLRRRRNVPRMIKAREKEKPIITDFTHKGTGSPNCSLPPLTVSSIWPGLLWNL
ncbi:hypothetical protein O181_068625 [Austropuccinia psidii MF-1]|uniref:Uncharacterized protein n=1 Tax=Austropuccinia psidii MF-1 TaxID=1389203 RepID=A0A9Q3I788_9BASI|nr:hypothetical protein [Austropuccinia psidii MF-1]